MNQCYPWNATTSTCSGGGGDDDDHHLRFLPEDFIIQILVCLPVISLLRLKSVCKSWRQLIDSSFFIDLHTTFNSSSSKFGAFILQSIDFYCEEEIKLFKLSSSDGDCDGYGGGGTGEDDDDKEDQKKVFKVDKLGFFPFYKDFGLNRTLRMVGSCNGIICLHDPMLLDDSTGSRYRQHYSNLRDVYLWNPATRQFRILPKSIPIEEKKGYMGNWLEDFIALGFDVKTKDYKVLRITPWKKRDYEGCMCRVQVYSLSTDSWRLLEGIDSLPVTPNQSMSIDHGIYLNGSYYFFHSFFQKSNICQGYFMLSFDFTNEIFTDMQPPVYNIILLSTYLGDKIVFTKSVTPPIGDSGYFYYDIWVLNEQHGGGSTNKLESWTKLHSFRIKSSEEEISYIQPRCISNNGEFALISTELTGNKLQLFNLITKEAKTDFAIGEGECRSDVYQESLVSIMGGGNVLLRWQLPTHGTTYKLYLNAPFIDYNHFFGIGLCLTSNTGGGCIGVRSLEKSVRDAAEGEALAMLEAIKWAKKLELSPIIIESESKRCVSFFMDDDDDDNNSTYLSSRALKLLRKAKLFLDSSVLGTSISFQYCSRSCNYVADIAAKLGREGDGDWDCMDWTANFPGEMVRSLSEES